MRSIMLFVVSLLILTSCSNEQGVSVKYPRLEPNVISDTYHNVSIDDPYRFMENMEDVIVKDWFKSQSLLTDSILSKLKNDEILDKIIEFENRQEEIVERFNIVKNGNYFYTETVDNVTSLYSKQNKKALKKLIFNPNEYEEGYLINYFKVSWDVSKVAISIAKKGDTKSEIIIFDINENELLPYVVSNTNPKNYGGINWLPDNSGFIYQHVPHFNTNAKDYGFNTVSVLYKIGENPKKIVPLLSKKNNPEIPMKEEDYPIISIKNENTNYLFGSLAGASNYSDTYIAKIPEDNSFENLKWEFLFSRENKINQYRIDGTSIIYRTAKGASNYKICKTSIESPDFNNPDVLVPEKNNIVITDFEVLEGDIYYTTIKNGVNSQFFVKTKNIDKEITLPYASGSSYVTVIGDHLNVSISGWTKPYSLFKYDKITSTFENVDLVTTKYPEFERYTVLEVEVPSHDGILVPLSIIYDENTYKKKDARTLISSYGSYGMPSSPIFYLPYLSWVAEGNILAIPHVRGGGEKGDAWHKAGMKTTKHNTWKDVIACTEYLIKENYTIPEKTIIYGVSAGGITVGRAITERPDLYAVALLDVPFLNTVRSEFQPNGANSVKEFGTINDSLEFKALLEMDSYHHIKPNTNYPAIYANTGMKDNSVVPWDPGKFIAKMQNMSLSKKPVLFQVDYGSGHGGDGTMLKFYKNMANMYAFALWQTGHPDYQLKE